MLKTRAITGVILGVTVLSMIYLVPIEVYGVFWWLVGLVGAYEYAGLAGLTRPLLRAGFAGTFTALVGLTMVFEVLVQPGLMTGAAVWIVAAIVVFAYPASGPYVERRATGILGIFILWAAWIALMVIRAAPDGSHWIMWLLLVSAVADIGAYFTGRQFGRHKLAPAVSPGKTWEGFWGGMLVSSLVCGGILAAMGRFNPGWLFIMVLLVSVSVLGDLFESVLKRERGVKDSGTILPGHGGVLDRIDSAVAVLPYFALILIFAGLSDRT